MLTDQQIASVRNVIAPLDPLSQDAFVAALNLLLANRPTIGDGELHRLLVSLQREHMTYPNARTRAAHHHRQESG